MDASDAFVNVFPGGGTYGKGRGTLSEEALAAIDARWQQVVAPATGAPSYEKLYEQVRGEPFPFETPGGGQRSSENLS